jgi:hypothetical protein
MLRLATVMIEAQILPGGTELLYDNPGGRLLAGAGQR